MSICPYKVLLIQPPHITGFAFPLYQPLGLMILASCLRNKAFMVKVIRNTINCDIEIENIPDYEIRIVDMQFYTLESISGIIKRFKPDLVGVRCLTEQINCTIDLLNIVKSHNHNTITIIGGVHISSLPEETLLKIENCDIGVIGEGEETFAQLTYCLSAKDPDLSLIDGIIYRRNNNLNLNKSRIPLFKDINHYPLPNESFDLLEYEKYKKIEIKVKGKVFNSRMATLVTSRGCNFNCNFCAENLLFRRKEVIEHVGKKIRWLSSDKVLEIINTYYRHGFRILNFRDDNFTYNKKNLIEICNGIIKNKWNLIWNCMARADYINEEMLELMEKSGCHYINLGVESGDQGLIDLVIKKQIKLKEIFKKTLLIKKYGINVKHYYMVGLPDQDWESIKKTANFIILQPYVDSINVSYAIPYPGSDFFYDSRVEMIINHYRHGPEPNLASMACPTKSNVMETSEIEHARDILIQLHYAVKSASVSLENIFEESNVKQLMKTIENKLIVKDKI